MLHAYGNAELLNTLVNAAPQRWSVFWPIRIQITEIFDSPWLKPLENSKIKYSFGFLDPIEGIIVNHICRVFSQLYSTMTKGRHALGTRSGASENVQQNTLKKAVNRKEASKGTANEISATDVASITKKIGKQLLSMSKTVVMKKDNAIDPIRTVSLNLQQSSQRSGEVKRASGDLVKVIGSTDLLKHKDKEVRLYVTMCCINILRLHAPDTPFSDETLREVFQAFTSVMKNLTDVSSPYFEESLGLLQMAAKIKCCLLMLDLDQAEILLLDLCAVIVASLTCHEVYDAIAEPALEVISTLVDESDVISQGLLDCILGTLAPQSLGGDVEEASDVAQVFAQRLLRKSRESLQPHIQKFLTQLLDGVRTDSDLVGNPSQLVLRVYQASPQIMLPVMPHLVPSLQVGSEERRLELVDLICKLLSTTSEGSPSSGAPDAKRKHLTEEYPELVDGILGRLSDKSTPVRLLVLQHSLELVSSLPMDHQKAAVVQAVTKRLYDLDEKVRCAAVVACSSIAADFPETIQTNSLYDALINRLWDKKISVRKEVALNIGKIIRKWCMKCENVDAFPNKKRLIEFIVGLCRLTQSADAELAAFIEDDVFRHGVLPMKTLSPSATCDWWSALWAESQEQSRKPIIDMMRRKCTVQENVASMLQLRIDAKAERKTRTSIHGLSNNAAANVEEGARVEKMTSSDRLGMKVKKVASLMKHVPKAEESLEKIFGMKDNNIFRNLNTMASMGAGFVPSSAAAKELQTRLGSRGPTSDLARILSARMCPTLVSPEVLGVAMKRAVENLHENTFVLDIAKLEPRLFATSLDIMTGLLTSGDEMAASLAAEIMSYTAKFIFISDRIVLDECCIEKLVDLCQCGRPHTSKAASKALMYATKYHEDRDEIVDKICRLALEGLKSVKVLNDHSLLLSHIKVVGNVMRMDMSKMELYASKVHSIVMEKFIPMDLSAGKPLRNNCATNEDPVWSKPSPDVEIKAELLKALSQSLVPMECSKELAPILQNVAIQFCEELQDLTDMDTSSPQFESFKWKLQRIDWSLAENRSRAATYTEDEKLALEKQTADSSPDAGWIRLAAAKALFRLHKTYDGIFTGNDYLGLGLACQDSMVEVRQALLRKIDSIVTYFQNLGPGGAKQRSAKFAALYALYGADPYEPNVKSAFHGLRKYIVKRRSILHKISLIQANSGRSGTMVNEMPEFALVFLVYFMSHHPDYDAEAMSQVDAGDELMALFKDSLQMFLEALIIPQSMSQSDKESLATVLKTNAGVSLKILRQLKYCHVLDVANDSVDPDASLNGHQICDIGLSLTRRLLHELSPVPNVSPSKFSGPIQFPKKFFQPISVTPEDKRLDGSDLPPQLKGPKLRELFSESCGLRMRFKRGKRKNQKGKAPEGTHQVVQQAKKKKVKGTQEGNVDMGNKAVDLEPAKDSMEESSSSEDGVNEDMES